MAVGDATIGYGGTLEINDGGGDSYVPVTAIVTVGVPSYTFGTVESKRLNREVIVMLKTLKKGETFIIKQDRTNAEHARMKALFNSRESKLFRVTVPDDAGGEETTVPGLVVGFKSSDMDPEQITTMETTVQVSDEEE
jgi:hypothetical protein